MDSALPDRLQLQLAEAASMTRVSAEVSGLLESSLGELTEKQLTSATLKKQALALIAAATK